MLARMPARVLCMLSIELKARACCLSRNGAIELSQVVVYSQRAYLTGLVFDHTQLAAISIDALKGGKMGYPGELLEIVCKSHVLGLRVGS
jgi:hypothetical protein